MSPRPSSTTTYDGYGRPLTVTDAAGNVTSMRYNALGQLVEVIAPARLVAPLTANGENAVDPFRNQLSETLVTIDDPGRLRPGRAAGARHLAGRRRARDPAKLRRRGQSRRHHRCRGQRQGTQPTIPPAA